MGGLAGSGGSPPTNLLGLSPEQINNLGLVRQGYTKNILQAKQLRDAVERAERDRTQEMTIAEMNALLAGEKNQIGREANILSAYTAQAKLLHDANQAKLDRIHQIKLKTTMTDKDRAEIQKLQSDIDLNLRRMGELSSQIHLNTANADRAEAETERIDKELEQGYETPNYTEYQRERIFDKVQQGHPLDEAERAFIGAKTFTIPIKGADVKYYDTLHDAQTGRVIRQLGETTPLKVGDWKHAADRNKLAKEKLLIHAEELIQGAGYAKNPAELSQAISFVNEYGDNDFLYVRAGASGTFGSPTARKLKLGTSGGRRISSTDVVDTMKENNASLYQVITALGLYTGQELADMGIVNIDAQGNELRGLQ